MADNPKPVNVPAGDLTTALELLEKQSGVEIVYRPDLLRGVHTGGVKGTLSSEEAVTTLAGAHSAVEMDQLLKDAGVPTELYFYPSESHIFWQPRHRAAAMEQNLDWFDFWLAGKRDSDPHKSAEYSRWDQMEANWKAVLERRAHELPMPGATSGGSGAPR